MIKLTSTLKVPRLAVPLVLLMRSVQCVVLCIFQSYAGHWCVNQYASEGTIIHVG